MATRAILLGDVENLAATVAGENMFAHCRIDMADENTVDRFAGRAFKPCRSNRSHCNIFMLAAIALGIPGDMRIRLRFLDLPPAAGEVRYAHGAVHASMRSPRTSE